LALAAGRARAEVFFVSVQSFTEKFELKLPRAAKYSLERGAVNFTVKDGVRTTVLSGRATMLVDGTAIVGDAGDTFSFLVADGRAHLVVHAGEMSITLPGYMTAVVYTGQFLPLRVSRFGAVEEPEAPQVEAPPITPPRMVGGNQDSRPQ